VRTIGLLGDHAPDQIPASHRDLARYPPVAALTTVTPGGYPQTSVVWCDFDGTGDDADHRADVLRRISRSGRGPAAVAEHDRNAGLPASLSPSLYSQVAIADDAQVEHISPGSGSRASNLQPD
jgi:hypothetical protein